jgi:NAD-dependent DNA ligase
LFKERRQESNYECDGIVVSQDVVPLQTKTNPKDAFAFKMALDDQRAQTTVKEVLWASSRTGNWIPRIHFEPVKIGTATIEYCSGFNAQAIMTHGIGPGAVILVRRSGDVIPVMESCLKKAPGDWQQPPTGLWKWDANNVHAVDTSLTVSHDKLALELTHGLVALGVEGISKTTAKKLVEGNVTTLQIILTTPVDKLQALIGKVNGSKLFEGLPKVMATASEAQWIYTYLGWPKAFGKTRIASTLELESDVSKWPSIGLPPKGISADSFAEVLKAVPAYLTWRTSFPSTVQTIIELPSLKVQREFKGNYVLTGFRDAKLQKRLEEAGWIQEERITKTTNLLIVSSILEGSKESGKMKSAREAGIRILPRDQVDILFQT